jgi:helicase-like protein
MPVTDGHCAPWGEVVPRIVAESLVTVVDPLDSAFQWPAPAPPCSVAAALARSAPPPEDRDGDAPWLRERQRSTARRTTGVVRRHGGALLADPVGSGKTFVALAVAAALRGDAPAAVLAPAPLVPQWRSRAAQCAVPVEILSHVAVSRGRLPDAATRVVLIDESHHFRHPATRRYGHLARFLVGRRMLAITATPTVNRLEDLAHQLLLGVRDDALRSAGTPSLRRALRAGEAPHALGQLVIATPEGPDLPARKTHVLQWAGERSLDPPSWLGDLDALALSARGEIAALIRCVLLGAAASSPAALRAALGRYAGLLRHGMDAQRAGHAVDRAMIRRFTAEAPEQLLLWEMLPAEVGAGALPLEDLDRVLRTRDAIDLAAPDPKSETLASLLGDGTPTLVFANAVATVPYLRDRLTDVAPAWITGSHAGWRHVRVPREQVLSWFRPGAPDVAPRILISSDVAAEGLDLQRASRVIHYDLPWTAMRLAQREGRSRRLGTTHSSVEVVRLEPPAWLERRLRIGATLQRKGLLGRRTGVEGEDSPWRWRHDLATRWDGIDGRCGVATIPGPRDEALVGLTIVLDDEEGGTTVLAIVDRNGEWTESPERVSGFLECARHAHPIESLEIDREGWVRAMRPLVRAVLRGATEGKWSDLRQAPEARALMGRAQQSARRAGRERDLIALVRWERLLAFAARGHTAGEALEVSELLGLDDTALARKDLGPRDARAEGGVVRIRVVGVLISRSRGA